MGRVLKRTAFKHGVSAIITWQQRKDLRVWGIASRHARTPVFPNLENNVASHTEYSPGRKFHVNTVELTRATDRD